MAEEISAGFETLMEQGSMTASVYLAEAVRRIDEQLGEQFAVNNPTLLGMFILAAALDCSGSIVAQQVRAGLGDARLMQCKLPDFAKHHEALATTAKEIVASYATAIGKD